MDERAQTVRIEDLEDNLMQAILGNGPLAGFAPLLKKLFNENVLGSNNDAILDAVLYTNMTPTGAFLQQQSSMQQRMASRQVSDLTRASRTQWFESAAKTLMSYESWSQSEEGRGKTLEQYNDFMRNRAEGMADNQALGFLLNMVGFDPEGINEARTYLSKAGANLVRHRKSLGDISAFTASRAMRNVFSDEEGNLTYDKRDYGYMTMGETSAVIAALTRDIDFFNTPDVQNAGSNVNKIKVATENIKKAAQEYTQALSPLKDVFGSDIPAMIQALEQMTGRRFTQMSSEQIGAASRRIMAGAEAGRYTLKQLTTVENQVENAIYGMDVPIINDISALAQAQTILGITNTGMIPSSMSAHRFEQLAADRVMRTSNSRGATAVNQAYALWRERQDKEGQPAFASDAEAFAAFQDKLRARGSEVSIDRALLELSGAANIYSLQEAAGSRYYQSAVEGNLGGVVAMERSTERRITQARLDAASNGNGDAFNEAIKVLQSKGGMSYMNAEAALSASTDISEAAKWQIRAIRNGRYGDLGAVMSAYQTSVDVAEKTQRNIRLRQGMDALNTDIAANALGVVRKFIGVGSDKYRGGLPDPASLRDILSESKAWNAADPETQRSIAIQMQAIGDMMQEEGIDITNKEAMQAYVDDAVKYVGKDAMYNSHYMDALLSYSQALEAGDSTMAKQAAKDMIIARYANEDLLSRYAEKHKGYNGLEGVDTAEINDVIKADLIHGKLTDLVKGDDKEVQDFVKNTLGTKMLDKAKDAGDMTSKQLEDLLNESDIGKKILTSHKEAVTNMFNTEVARSDARTTTQTDLFGMFNQLIDKINELLTGIKPFVPPVQPNPGDLTPEPKLGGK